MAQQTRKDPRAKVLSMTVRYKSATLDEFIEHHSHDVSRGGMFIKTPQPFPPGTLLKFEVRIAEDRKVMQGVGRVVWKRDNVAADVERPSGMGVKFIKLDDDSRQLIDQLLSNRQDEGSAFDTERAADVDGEAPVGLGQFTATEPKSAERVNSFFPKTDNEPLPAPEDRTVMKQASELLEEALREVGGATEAEKKPTSLAPATDDTDEDTKPGRPSRSVESLARLPRPNLPPSPGSDTPTDPHQKVKAASEAISASKLIAAAKAVTASAEAVTENKAGNSKPSAPLSTKPQSPKPLAMERKSATSLTSSSTAPKSVAAAKVAPVKPASGQGRGVFWFLAVAASVGVVYWVTRSKPVAPPRVDAETAEQASAIAVPQQEPTMAPAVVEAPPVETAVASAAVASASATPEPVASVAPPVETAPPVAAPNVAVAAMPAKVVAAKPKASKKVETEQPAAATEQPTATEAAPVVAKPAEPAEPAEPAAPAPAPTPPKTKSVASDNPY